MINQIHFNTFHMSRGQGWLIIGFFVVVYGQTGLFV